MWFKKRQKSTETTTLYLSIDGCSIGLSLYTNNICNFSDRRIHVMYEDNIPIEALLKDILYGFKYSYPKPFDQIFVILESPWIIEKSLDIKEKRMTPFVINQEIINNLINKQEENNKTTFYDLPYVVERVALNGYVYPDPIGKITKEIEISITKFSADKEIIEFLNKEIKEFWNKTKIIYLSGPLLISNIGKNLIATNDIFVNLNSTNTVLHLYSTGVVNGNIIISFGLQHILQGLNNKWKTTNEESLNWIDLFLNKTLNEAELSRITADLRLVIAPYIDSFTKKDFKTNFIIERPINILGGNVIWNKLFTYLLKEKYFGELFPHIDTTVIKDISDGLNDLKGDRLIAIYARSDELKK
ncbi:hypothetical protein A3C57_00535 [Candidatus Nomurabacteria bacterium RIFCSPHIGHO2_02_FULL_33_12]|uniref:SHS2 domain-containing protein n=1 Tax=Candidatus Nomurabacteria bacterium RIFCSPLOWO2_01_FULL_33_17 TaxID=1801764 RepID=A0A1F6WQA1_9BACT|nr:MAG: hypothetical protein A3C57_00535 [Candidatus Nomurabacteria bacterium RIFCSPHIGHO2_02_FULL_33_12]OGI84061.1 MAG: hypothetical protein A2903_02265 [Candidatus Nomurabacteria bacterium RIFCSPLOWO2_01_FULL_33_17]